MQVQHRLKWLQQPPIALPKRKPRMSPSPKSPRPRTAAARRWVLQLPVTAMMMMLLKAAAVASHYNAVKQGSRGEREKSRIFHLRAFNNWIKSQLISQALNKVFFRGSQRARLTGGMCGGARGVWAGRKDLRAGPVLREGRGHAQVEDRPRRLRLLHGCEPYLLNPVPV